ncbi:hypothetical protein D3C87_1822810 [compost metagenome]
MTISKPTVRKICATAGAFITRLIRNFCVSTPSTKATANDSSDPTSGSSPSSFQAKYATNMPTIRNSAWAKLTMDTTPKTSVSPIEITA